MSEKRALIVRGGWAGHSPRETTDEVLPFLKANGYAVQVAENPEVYADVTVMKSVDIIIQSVTLGQITREAVSGLTAAVRAGAGLVGWHGGIVDSFRGNAEYLHLVGGQFAHHPARTAHEERLGDGTDNFIPHSIRFLPAASGHPVSQGIADFDLETEQYWVLTDLASEVLATITIAARPFDPWREPITFPAVWTRSWASGRIVVITPGHRLEDVRHPSVRTMIERGILWATR